MPLTFSLALTPIVSKVDFKIIPSLKIQPFSSHPKH